jgi:hypothetical protein
MRPDDPEQELELLRSACQRIADNLLELEAEPTRELLEKSAVQGTTKERWSQANASLSELWRERGLLDTLLQQADKARRRKDELHALLNTRSIELSSDDVPLAERRLLEGPERTLRCSPRELMERMSRSFDDVKSALSQIGAAWDKLLPALERTRKLAAECQTLATDLGESDRSDLAAARNELDRLNAAVSSDPLSASANEVDRHAASLEAIRDELAAVAALKQDYAAQLARARGLLESLRRAIDDANAAYDEVVVKIATPTGVLRPRELAGGPSLASCEAFAQRGAWREARRELGSFTKRATALLDDAEGALTANRAPLQSRNQLRALLDAYQVKAARLGVVEDPRVAAIYERSKTELYTAPTDVAAAGDLVRRYQQAVSNPREAAL